MIPPGRARVVAIPSGTMSTRTSLSAPNARSLSRSRAWIPRGLRQTDPVSRCTCPKSVAPIDARLACDTAESVWVRSAEGSHRTPKASTAAIENDSPAPRRRPGFGRRLESALRTFSIASIISSSSISSVSSPLSSGAKIAGTSLGLSRSIAGRDQWVRGRLAVSRMINVASPKHTATSRRCACPSARHRPKLSNRVYCLSAVICSYSILRHFNLSQRYWIGRTIGQNLIKYVAKGQVRSF